ncbi:MAG TPA: hypothetical protein VL463_13460 [Kofleriaceae bacterium]|nr:hypothetical protein [Kofleriaceae bacterium]
MATVELGSLGQHLEDEEVQAIRKALRKHDVTLEDNDHDTVIVARDLDSDIVADFLDRLDAHEASADIYVPAEFDGVVKAGGYKVASAPQLVHVLEEMKEELLAEDDDEDEEPDDEDEDEDGDEEEEEEEDEYESSGSLKFKDDQLRGLWKVLFKAASEAADNGSVLFVKS